MPQPLQLPEGSIVLSNQFGDGPFEHGQQFARVILPRAGELEASRMLLAAFQPERFQLYAFALTPRSAFAHRRSAMGTN